MLEELVVEQRLHQPPHLAGAELGLGLALELGLRELDRDHRGEALAHVVARQVVRDVLPVLHVGGDVAVERARERRPEAHQVGAALDGVDVVREGVDALVVGLVVLERDLDGDHHLALAAREGALARHQDRRGVERGAAAGQVLDEGDDPALVVEVVTLAAALVGEQDAHAGGQERELAQALGERV